MKGSRFSVCLRDVHSHRAQSFAIETRMSPSIVTSSVAGLLLAVTLAGCSGPRDLAALPACPASALEGHTPSVTPYASDPFIPDSFYAALPSVIVPDSLVRSELLGRYASSDGYVGYRLRLRDTERSTRKPWSHNQRWPFTLLTASETVQWEIEGGGLVLRSPCPRWLCAREVRPCLREERYDIVEVNGRIWLIGEGDRSFARFILELESPDHQIVDTDVYTARD